MGGLCSSGMATSASVEVQADGDTMWSVIADLEASAAAISAVQSLEYLDRSNRSKETGKFEVGTVVREKRRYKLSGKSKKAEEFVIRRQIVAISDESIDEAASHPKKTQNDHDTEEAASPQPQVRSVSFSTHVEKPEQMSKFSNTSTLTVVSLTEETCELVGTYAVKSTGIVMTLWVCCWKLVRNYSNDNFSNELRDLANAAEKKATQSS